MRTTPLPYQTIMRIALVLAMLASLVLSPLAQGQGERTCTMAAASLGWAGLATTCKVCCKDAMPCCAFSEREESQPQPQPLSNEQDHSHRQLLAAPILTFFPLSWCISPPEHRILLPREQSVAAPARALRAEVSCIWLI